MRILSILTLVIASLMSASGAIQNPQPNQSPDFAKSTELNSAAVKLFNEGRYEEALPLETQALELREKAVGPNDAELIPILKNLGEIYKSKAKAQESAASFNRALKLAEKAYGPNDIRLAAILDPLAFVEYGLKQAATAEDLLAKSLKIKEAELSPKDPEIAETAFNLGQVYAARANYKGAAQSFSRAITIWESEGKSRWKLVKALDRYSLVLIALGKKDEAVKVQQRLGELSSPDALFNGGVVNGKALVLATPPYPSVHTSGTVQVRVVIDEHGQVLTAKALPTRMDIEFVRASENAARQSRFTPTFVDGKAVTVSGIIVYNFVAR